MYFPVGHIRQKILVVNHISYLCQPNFTLQWNITEVIKNDEIIQFFQLICGIFKYFLKAFKTFPWIFRNTTKKNRIARTNIKNKCDALSDLVLFVKLKKNAKSTHSGMLLLLKSQVSASNFTKSITLPWVFFILFKLYKWWQIVQTVPNT